MTVRRRGKSERERLPVKVDRGYDSTVSKGEAVYRIDRSANRIEALNRQSFSELGFKERQHLQEWIAHNPSVLGEDLFIIAKEFSGFDDTHERLDLLALDKNGSLVIIENKIDDAGRDVTWQALKYASYCSSLTRDQVRDIYAKQNALGSAEADQAIADFLDEDGAERVVINRDLTQRIILVAGQFRKEVTSTVMWLRNFNVRLQCVTASVFSKGDDLFLDVKQIIPTPGAEEYMIGIAKKNQAEAAGEDGADGNPYRKEFWVQLLKALKTKTNTFNSISARQANALTTRTGYPGFRWVMVAKAACTRVQLSIDTGDVEDNVTKMARLEASRDQIETAFGASLEWLHPAGVRGARCRIRDEHIWDMSKKETWPAMIDSMVDRMLRLQAAMTPHLDEV